MEMKNDHILQQFQHASYDMHNIKYHKERDIISIDMLYLSIFCVCFNREGAKNLNDTRLKHSLLIFAINNTVISTISSERLS